MPALAQIPDLPQPAARLRELRLALGYSQVELAKALSRAQVTVSQWERGIYQPPPDVLDRLITDYEARQRRGRVPADLKRAAEEARTRRRSVRLEHGRRIAELCAQYGYTRAELSMRIYGVKHQIQVFATRGADKREVDRVKAKLEGWHAEICRLVDTEAPTGRILAEVRILAGVRRLALADRLGISDEWLRQVEIRDQQIAPARWARIRELLTDLELRRSMRRASAARGDEALADQS